jgi:hypothetical protein
MTVVLRFLADLAWVAYLSCAGLIVYFGWRALAARRERSRALFTAERETASRRLASACVMAVLVSLIGLMVFVIATFIVPALEASTSPLATPTLSSGVEPPTVTGDGGSTPPAVLATATSAPTRGAVATPPPPHTAQPTEPGAAQPSGSVNVQFGDFAELVSYEVASTDVAVGETLVLTLTWEALEGTSPRNYSVFAHLLSEGGELLAQHDGEPGGRQTTGWVTGERIVDGHRIEVQNTSYVGPAQIAVGLYDVDTGRVLTETGEDLVILPVTIEIVSGEAATRPLPGGVGTG